jgi:predicted esterase
MPNALVCTLVLAFILAGPVEGEELAYPAGRSSQSIEGLQVELHLPAGLEPAQPASLIVILHGAGGSATGMAGSLREWVALGYVICAPKSTGDVWSDADVDAVKRIAAHLKKKLPIDPTKVHVMGFSNGGWNLDPLAFDDDLRPCSATWIAAGCRTGSAPKWAQKGLGVLALAGSEDGNAKSARDTIKLLQGDVASVEARFQPGLGHKWPDQLMPYCRWWQGTREGRFIPGEDLNFEWGDSVDAAVSALAEQKKGGILVYLWSTEDADKPHAKALQNTAFMDGLVRHYGGQLQAVKLDAAARADAMASWKIKETPAVVVLKKDGTLKKALFGASKLTAKRIASALKSVAPNKKKPE